MLDRIAEIKKYQGPLQISCEQINDLALEWYLESFISRSENPISINSDVEAVVIQNPQELLKLGKAAQSCIYRKYDDEESQLRAYQRFLDDPGALYFTLESADCTGYFRCYAGQMLEDGSEVLFEDVLRTQKKPLRGRPALFHPKLKAVVAITLKRLGLAEDSFLYIPHENIPHFEDGQELCLEKMGSDFFKKGMPEDFYNGDHKDDRWPRFANVNYLLNL
ncbi:hypothetical protein CL619_03765 [archaeon]|nr:hypothetical protein [archaeon]|tara:strand:+ start:607 stop:1269 length:663 start_codon:yes stop_codon:yes gene_type:complete